MKVFIIIACILTWIFLIYLINNTANFLDSKKEYFRVLALNEKKDDIVSRVNATAAFLKLLDTLIAIEIETLIDSLKLIKQPYNILRLDKDIKNISTKVFNSIKKELYNEDELCIASDFLLQFITTQVTNKFTEMVLNSNIGIYAANSEEINE